jgi:hypothetical protein
MNDSLGVNARDGGERPFEGRQHHRESKPRLRVNQMGPCWRSEVGREDDGSDSGLQGGFEILGIACKSDPVGIADSGRHGAMDDEVRRAIQLPSNNLGDPAQG